MTKSKRIYDFSSFLYDRGRSRPGATPIGTAQYARIYVRVFACGIRRAPEPRIGGRARWWRSEEAEECCVIIVSAA